MWPGLAYKDVHRATRLSRRSRLQRATQISAPTAISRHFAAKSRSGLTLGAMSQTKRRVATAAAVPIARRTRSDVNSGENFPTLSGEISPLYPVKLPHCLRRGGLRTTFRCTRRNHAGASLLFEAVTVAGDRDRRCVV